ncbi:MAG TPA: DMT family transporter [Rhodanobacteraceae bacterium]|nr:DMT family transporter [Rhodanobacteraceae bacterium]
MGIGEACSIGAALSWAAGVIVYKRLGESLAPGTLNLVKNVLVLAMIVPSVPLVHGFAMPALSANAVVLALLSGVLGIAVADTLYFKALNTLGAGRMGVVGNFYSPFVIVLSFAFLGERLSALQLAGFALVSGGVVIVSGHDPSRRLAKAELRRGALLGVAAVLLMAAAIVMIKRVLESAPLFWIVLLRLVGGVAGMLAVFAWRREPLPFLGRQTPGRSAAKLRWPLLLLAAFLGQYVSMALWMAGYKYTEASVAAVLNETASVFIVLLAALFLREGLDARRLVGVTCTLSGVACMLAA